MRKCIAAFACMCLVSATGFGQSYAYINIAWRQGQLRLPLIPTPNDFLCNESSSAAHDVLMLRLYKK
ncbi:hypothetical protein [Segetibacter aerophilus]|uniref:hypothetical protein n=1 Tax=Segetibacter aerophilus TaxID=670293 RepID=UPI0011BFCB3F|nr:hypothetical protein [Segetibacter aerophilus]